MHSNPIDWTGVQTRRIRRKKGTIVFSQGDVCETVLYIEQGSVRLSVVSHAGKEAIVAVIESGHFFGEGCLVRQPQWMATATAVISCILVEIDGSEFTRQMLATPARAGVPHPHAHQERSHRRGRDRSAVQ